MINPPTLDEFLGPWGNVKGCVNTKTFFLSRKNLTTSSFAYVSKFCTICLGRRSLLQKRPLIPIQSSLKCLDLYAYIVITFVLSPIL